MNAPLTTDQRQQVAQAWRQSSQAQQMPPTQVEQFAQQILGGQADVQVQQYVSQNQAQQITMAGGSGAFSLQTPFGAIQIPGMPNLQIPGIQPMQFSGLPQLPTMTPMSPPQLPGMPMMPPTSPQQQPMPGTSMLTFSPGGQGMPQYSQQSAHFPGGSANHHNISLSGQSGNATFSYSSSSTSGNWSNNSFQPTMQPAFPALQSYTSPLAIGGIPPTSGFIQPVPPTPMLQQQQAFPQPAVYSPAPQHAQPVDSPAPQPQFPPQPTFAPAPQLQPQPAVQLPQNPRMGNAFNQQLNEETYFSQPPGAPDISVPQEAPQAQGQRKQTGPDCGPKCPACLGDRNALHDWQNKPVGDMMHDFFGVRGD